MSETCASFTFTLRQMGQRDELVLKSVIRLLQSKTRHTWLHCDNNNSNLVLLGDQPEAGRVNTGLTSGQQAVVHFNSAGRRDVNALAWPIRSDELLRRLNEAGEQLGRHHQQPAAGLFAGPAPQPAAPPGLSNAPSMQRLFLVRWPDAALLRSDPRFTKLATMLTGRPVNLVDLAARSATPLHVCKGFADLLNAAGLLRVVEPAALTQTAGAQAGFAASSSRPASTSSTTRPAVQAPRGLISRIRQRLEMIIGSSADRRA